MNLDFVAAMRRAAQLTRAQDISGAMRVIKAALAGQETSDPGEGARERSASRPRPLPSPRLLDLKADTIATSTMPEPSSARSDTAEPGAPAQGLFPGIGRLRKPLGEALQTLQEGRQKIGGLELAPFPTSRRPTPSIPDSAQFLTRSYVCEAGRRGYKLYIPASAPDQPRGLVVMLHGCKQNPDDFAVGTNMNALAETYGVIVAYPGQPGAANVSSCWNWFRPSDQIRGAGEPAIIAGLTGELMAEFELDREHVFVAGLSAGAAMAAVMGETYPDLYAGVGLHSGLAYGSANDVMSAFAAMRGEESVGQAKSREIRVASGSRPRMIVFQGSSDPVVHASNAERIVAAAVPHGVSGHARKESRHSVGGRGYTRAVVSAPNGDAAVEYWLIDGAGHAWSGGHPGGSFTDPTGPDASGEMMRFFFGQASNGRKAR